MRKLTLVSDFRDREGAKKLVEREYRGWSVIAEKLDLKSKDK